MELAQLIDERAIQRQLFAIAEAMDRRDWVSLERILTEDATGDFGPDHILQDRSAFVGMFHQFLGSCGPTQHLLGNIVVNIDGDIAESSCYVRDMHQGRGDLSHLHFSSPGQYRDRWRRTAEGWQLVHRTKINLMFIGSIEALGSSAGNSG